MEGWLEALLYFAADAAARAEWVQAAQALDAFSACLAHGAPLNVRPLSIQNLTLAQHWCPTSPKSPAIGQR